MGIVGRNHKVAGYAGDADEEPKRVAEFDDFAVLVDLVGIGVEESVEHKRRLDGSGDDVRDK